MSSSSGRQWIAGQQLAADDLNADRVHHLAVQAAPRIGKTGLHATRCRIGGS